MLNLKNRKIFKKRRSQYENQLNYEDWFSSLYNNSRLDNYKRHHPTYFQNEYSCHTYNCRTYL